MTEQQRPVATLQISPPDPKTFDAEPRADVELMVDGEVVSYRLRNLADFRRTDAKELGRFTSMIPLVSKASSGEPADLLQAASVLPEMARMVFYDPIPMDVIEAQTSANLTAIFLHSKAWIDFEQAQQEQEPS